MRKILFLLSVMSSLAAAITEKEFKTMVDTINIELLTEYEKKNNEEVNNVKTRKQLTTYLLNKYRNTDSNGERIWKTFENINFLKRNPRDNKNCQIPVDDDLASYFKTCIKQYISYENYNKKKIDEIIERYIKNPAKQSKVFIQTIETPSQNQKVQDDTNTRLNSDKQQKLSVGTPEKKVETKKPTSKMQEGQSVEKKSDDTSNKKEQEKNKEPPLPKFIDVPDKQTRKINNKPVLNEEQNIKKLEEKIGTLNNLILILLAVLGVFLIYYFLTKDKNTKKKNSEPEDSTLKFDKKQKPKELKKPKIGKDKIKIHKDSVNSASITDKEEKLEKADGGLHQEADISSASTLTTDNPKEPKQVDKKETLHINKDKDFSNVEIKEEKLTIKESLNWLIVHTSEIGLGHIEATPPIPCQDNHAVENLENNWGIAVVCDGAGSAKLSHDGSKQVSEEAIELFKHIINREKWCFQNKLPEDERWAKISFRVLLELRKNLEKRAKYTNETSGSFASTIIVVIYTPIGLLVTHIGDGRAGYKNQKGEWKAIITPHNGDEANQTIFITSNEWLNGNHQMSGVSVPESKVIREHPRAFTLLSDGCDENCFETIIQDKKTGKCKNVNRPYARFFNPITKNILNSYNDGLTHQEVQENWSKFIQKGTEKFRNEKDDKTLIVGILNDN